MHTPGKSSQESLWHPHSKAVVINNKVSYRNVKYLRQLLNNYAFRLISRYYRGRKYLYCKTEKRSNRISLGIRHAKGLIFSPSLPAIVLRLLLVEQLVKKRHSPSVSQSVLSATSKARGASTMTRWSVLWDVEYTRKMGGGGKRAGEQCFVVFGGITFRSWHSARRRWYNRKNRHLVWSPMVVHFMYR